MTQRRFERSIYLYTTIAMAIASSSLQAEVLHGVRLQENDMFVDVVGGALLGGAAARGQEFVPSPNDVDAAGASFPRAGAGSKRYAIQSQSNANSFYVDDTTPVSDAHTHERRELWRSSARQ